ncbi:MAG TPA: DUF4136 domain-containing protein [Terracidiphilus sp.]|nr:DUF4136 domain-containing protein [Terracidiphilus sp.]
MKQAWRAVLTTFTLIVATSLLFAADVKTDYNHHFDFSQVHTYSWGQVTTSNPLFVQRIKDEVNKDLEAKGWTLQPSGGAAVIFARGRVHNQQELETYYNGLGGWGGRWGWGGWAGGGFGESTVTTTNQPVGMLVVDIFNGKSKDLLWRGASRENLSNKSAKNNTRNLDKDIDKMFAKFPPRK